MKIYVCASLHCSVQRIERDVLVALKQHYCKAGGRDEDRPMEWIHSPRERGCQTTRGRAGSMKRRKRGVERCPLCSFVVYRIHQIAQTFCRQVYLHHLAGVQEIVCILFLWVSPAWCLCFTFMQESATFHCKSAPTLVWPQRLCRVCAV